MSSPTPADPNIIEVIAHLTPFLSALSPEEADPLKRLVITSISRAISHPLTSPLPTHLPFPTPYTLPTYLLLLKNLTQLSDIFTRFEWPERLRIEQLKNICFDAIVAHSLAPENEHKHTLQECRLLLEFLAFVAGRKIRLPGWVEGYKEKVVGDVVAKVSVPELEGDPFTGLREIALMRKFLLENGWWDEEISRSIQRHANVIGAANKTVKMEEDPPPPSAIPEVKREPPSSPPRGVNPFAELFALRTRRLGAEARERREAYQARRKAHQEAMVEEQKLREEVLRRLDEDRNARWERRE
ncbi:MAG: hypothetical protein Q9195_009271 [Heterodermia aff. obscurata]